MWDSTLLSSRFDTGQCAQYSSSARREQNRIDGINVNVAGRVEKQRGLPRNLRVEDLGCALGCSNRQAGRRARVEVDGQRPACHS